MQIAPISETTQATAKHALGGVGSSDSYAPAPAEGAGPQEASFGDVFTRLVAEANHADAFASQKVDALARGIGDDLHGTMIAVKEADISVKLVATIRNKLLDAFNEIWKTSV